MESMENVAPVVRNIIDEIADVVNAHCPELGPVALYALTRHLAGFVNVLNRDKYAREAGMTGQKAIELIGKYLTANLAKDGPAIGKVVDEMFCGTLTIVQSEQDGEALKNVH
jgi:hypothetical protein